MASPANRRPAPSRQPVRTPARQTPPANAIQRYVLTPVEFVESEVAAPETEVAVDLTNEGYNEAPSSLTPTANWTTPGQYIEGVFLGQQENIGPNQSRLYNFRMPDNQIVSVWGGTVLDNRMDMMRPPAGSIVKIVYIGDAPKKPGQNPARLFKMGWKSA